MLVDKGKSNRWLASQLGKNPATVSKWCTNSAQPTLETMMQIAKLLNVGIFKRYPVDEYQEDERKVKLKPIKKEWHHLGR